MHDTRQQEYDVTLKTMIIKFALSSHLQLFMNVDHI